MELEEGCRKAVYLFGGVGVEGINVLSRVKGEDGGNESSDRPASRRGWKTRGRLLERCYELSAGSILEMVVVVIIGLYCKSGTVRSQVRDNGSLPESPPSIHPSIHLTNLQGSEYVLYQRSSPEQRLHVSPDEIPIAILHSGLARKSSQPIPTEPSILFPNWNRPRPQTRPSPANGSLSRDYLSPPSSQCSHLPHRLQYKSP